MRCYTWRRVTVHHIVGGTELFSMKFFERGRAETQAVRGWWPEPFDGERGSSLYLPQFHLRGNYVRPRWTTSIFWRLTAELNPFASVES